MFSFTCARCATITPPRRHPPPPSKYFGFAYSSSAPLFRYDQFVSGHLLRAAEPRPFFSDTSAMMCDREGVRKRRTEARQTEFFDSKNAFWAC